MGLYRYLHRGMVAGTLATALGALAQSTVAVNVGGALLPSDFGAWKAAPDKGDVPEFSLANAKKAALQECNPQRSAVADYATEDHGGQIKIHVEAIEFNDRTGAYSAFTLIRRPGMKEGTDLGSLDAVGGGAILFTTGSSLVLVTGGSGNVYEVASLKPLAAGLPKVSGTKGIAPLLPTLLPAKALVPGSVRYALGAESYAAQGGVLPAQSLGWDKSAEAVTAQYDDRRGKENLTMLLYPTPAIAGSFARAIEGFTAGKGKVRREGELALLAEGTFSADEAQKMIENIHLKQQLSFDRNMPPVFQVEVVKTYSLLTNIAVLTGVLMAAAILLGLFLGGGRAAIRVMRGKSAAVEPEFLSLHLNPQNASARFETDSPEDRK
jgi:hypothetical protein